MFLQWSIKSSSRFFGNHKLVFEKVLVPFFRQSLGQSSSDCALTAFQYFSQLSEFAESSDQSSIKTDCTPSMARTMSSSFICASTASTLASQTWASSARNSITTKHLASPSSRRRSASMIRLASAVSAALPCMEMSIHAFPAG